MNDILNAFGVGAICVKASCHRHFEFYDLVLNRGYKVSSIKSYGVEIALALKSKTMPIITPIMEEGVVRIKLAKRSADLIKFDTIIKEHSVPDGVLPFLFGETDDGEPMWVDMADNPHLLCAGGTGSGKSTFLHVIIANALHRNDVNLYISDPKAGVEFSQYERYIRQFETSYEGTVAMLSSIELLMQTRYEYMRRFGCANATKLNLTKEVVIIDEIADLMLIDKDNNNPLKGKLERCLISLAQKARAANIFLVIATQRPSVDVLTGVIKANFPARLACRVSSSIDSKVVIDREGAETLLGKGDALFVNVKHNCTRFQIAYTTPELTLSGLWSRAR